MNRTHALLQLTGFALCGLLFLPFLTGAVPDRPVQGEQWEESSAQEESHGELSSEEDGSEDSIPESSNSSSDITEFEESTVQIMPLPLELEPESTQEDVSSDPGDSPEELATDEGSDALDYILLSESEAVVFTFGELSELLTADNGITVFYFGDNIEYEYGGAAIPDSKPHVVFDGVNPLDESGTVHTLLDYNSSRFLDTVRIESAQAERSITARNMEIEGHNYYGPFSVWTDVRDCSIYYQNVIYRGPQFAHNRWGLVRFTDCDITIQYNGASAANEVAEATRVEFAGQVDITHNSTTRMIYFETGAGEVVLLEGAQVEINQPVQDMSFAYANSFTLEIGPGAALRYTSLGRFNESPMTSLIIQEGGELDIRCTGRPPDVVAQVNGDITIKEGGLLRMVGTERNTDRALLRLTGNLQVSENGSFHLIAPQGYNFNMTVLDGGTVDFQDPKSVLFYNTSNPICFYNAPGTLSVSAQQVNYWSSPQSYDDGAGNLDDPPQSGWRKADGSLFTLSGTVSAGTNGNFTAITSNYQEGDRPGYAPDAVNFHLDNARMLAFGRMELEAEPLFETSPSIDGWVDHPLAHLRASYRDPDPQVAEGLSHPESGFFSLELLNTIPEGELVLLEANRWGLSDSLTLTVGMSNVAIRVPEAIYFESQTLSGLPVLAGRIGQEPVITVVDNRGVGSDWQLTAHLEQPFTPQNSQLPALSGGLVFVDGNGKLHHLSEHSTIPIAEHVNESPSETVEISWEADRGILLQIPPGEGLVNHTYTAVIRWNLADVP